MESMLDCMSGELDESRLEFFVRWAEPRYFKGIEPVSAVGISADLEGPACFLSNENRILVNAAVAQFPRWCGVLLLHELIHSKLYKQNGDPDEDHGERFQAELDRLTVEGAYKGR